MPRLAQRCRPLSPSPSPQKQAFESTLIALAGEPLIQYQICFKRACFEGEGSQTYFIYKSHVLRGGELGEYESRRASPTCDSTGQKPPSPERGQDGQYVANELRVPRERNAPERLKAGRKGKQGKMSRLWAFLRGFVAPCCPLGAGNLQGVEEAFEAF
ncbi:hypothetical protein [Roseimaritima multifibrata]|nr:hypothetical protein [Roseimaritima multifibrata]